MAHISGIFSHPGHFTLQVESEWCSETSVPRYTITTLYGVTIQLHKEYPEKDKERSTPNYCNCKLGGGGGGVNSRLKLPRLQPREGGAAAEKGAKSPSKEPIWKILLTRLDNTIHMQRCN